MEVTVLVMRAMDSVVFWASLFQFHSVFQSRRADLFRFEVQRGGYTFQSYSKSLKYVANSKNLLEFNEVCRVWVSLNLICRSCLYTKSTKLHYLAQVIDIVLEGETFCSVKDTLAFSRSRSIAHICSRCSMTDLKNMTTLSSNISAK